MPVLVSYPFFRTAPTRTSLPQRDLFTRREAVYPTAPPLDHARFRLIARSLATVGALAVAFGLVGCATAAPKAPGGSSAIVRHTAVPAPSGGSINQTVPSATPGAVTSVSITKPAVLPSKVTISIVSAKFATVKATTPGEIAGPAIEATVLVHNGTSSTIDLGSTVVTLTEASGALGQPTTSSPAQPFTQSLAPGASMSGVYVFRVPKSGYNPVQITVSYAGGAPVALFTGTVS